MWQQEFIWFFTLFQQEFRKNNPIAFEVLMGVVYSWGRAGIAADIRYTFGTPWSCSKRRPMPNAMPQRQHTR